MAEAYSSGPWSVHTEDSVDSTQKWVRQRISVLEDRSVLLAVSQTEGRGRSGKTWLSPPGGFYASLLLKPAPPINFAPLVSLLAAFVISEEMRSRGIPAQVKWPNDVVVSDRKVAGIIAETGSAPESWFVLGTGVNLVSEPGVPGRSILPPGSWSRFGEPPEPRELLNTFLTALDRNWPHRKDNPTKNIHSKIVSVLWNLGRMVTVEAPDARVEGVVEGIDHSGFLVLSTNSGERRFVSGELLTVHGERV